MATTNLRFDETEETLFSAIKKSAKQNKRSMNAEILRAIEYYLKNAPEAQYQTALPKLEEPKGKKAKSNM